MAAWNSVLSVAPAALRVMNTGRSTQEARAPGGSGGMAWSRVRPASSETVTNCRPLARNASIRRGSAASVCERSPPESCNSTISPRESGLGSLTAFMTRSMMVSAAGFFQSSGSTLRPTVR